MIARRLGENIVTGTMNIVTCDNTIYIVIKRIVTKEHILQYVYSLRTITLISIDKALYIILTLRGGDCKKVRGEHCNWHYEYCNL